MNYYIENDLKNITELIHVINTSLWIFLGAILFIFIMWFYALYSTIKIKDMMKQVCKMLEMQTLLTNKIDDKLKSIDEKIIKEEKEDTNKVEN